MRGHVYWILDMTVQCVYATYMVCVQVCQDHFTDSTPLGDQIIDTCRQRLLLVFIGRSWVDDKNLARVVNEITVRMCRRRFGRRAHGEAYVVGAKLDAAHWLTVSLGNRK